jgi:uncharacterized membrane protein YeaQ/YmgE (transglycosylase-associated protein family)
MSIPSRRTAVTRGGEGSEDRVKDDRRHKMEWVVFFLVLALSGLVVGALARLVVPGPETIGVLGTILAGIGGSLIGGLIGRLLFGDTNWLGSLLLAVAGAILLILPFRAPRRIAR